MKRKLHHATLNVVARKDEGVERAEPGAAPTAFRIWRAGENKADDGSVFFTADSAAKLMAEQASKNRPLSIDYDHLSLTEDRPAEAGKAAGWHSIEARDTEAGPELWAVNVQWCATAKEGIEQQPPTWRFFSPAFFTDEDNEVTSYINLALCINPMTHGIPLLASRKLTKETTQMMTAKEQLSALDALIAATDDTDMKATLQAVRDAIAADAADEGEIPADDAAPVAASADADGAVKHAEIGDDDKKDDKKEASVKTHAAKIADPVASLAAKVVELERREEVREISDLLSKHVGLPDEFRMHCLKSSLPEARVMIKAVAAAAGPKMHARKAAPSQGSTDGSSALDPRDSDAIDRMMGMKTHAVTMPHKMTDGTGRFVLHNVRPSDLLRANAQKGKV